MHLMYETEYLTLLQKLYEWSVVGPDDVDDIRYIISKKLSEVNPKSKLRGRYDRYLSVE